MQKILLLISLLCPLSLYAQISGGSTGGPVTINNGGGGLSGLTIGQGVAPDTATTLAPTPEVETVSDGLGHRLTACHEDRNQGVYDPRCTRYAGGVFGSTPWLAAQAVENQAACDLSMGVVTQAKIEWPQGTFLVDNLLMAPGSWNIGKGQSDGGTTLQTRYNNHATASAPITLTATCSDSQQHTDNLGFTRVSYFQFTGCGQAACGNAPGDTNNYTGNGGPQNTGFAMDTNGTIEYLYARNFGGFGLRVDGQDAKAWHNRTYQNDLWYYYGGYKGIAEGSAAQEVSAVTTGSTSSVTLTWTAVSGAAGYLIYRGDVSPGHENSGFYISGTTSFTDTGATPYDTWGYTGVTQYPFLAAPASPTATPSATGGTLAAGTHYYRIVPYTSDGWHGSAEMYGLDLMADWLEVYGLFDSPNKYDFHHLADIIGGGGDSHLDHFWPQLGLVGIAQPYGQGFGDMYTNARIDFARQEGFWTGDVTVSLTDSIIDGSCTAPNAATANTGQDGARFAGTCTQYFSTGIADTLSNVKFSDNSGFGATVKTADILMEDGSSTAQDTHGATFQVLASEGVLAGSKFDSFLDTYLGTTGANPNVMGRSFISPVDSSPVSITGFMNAQQGQWFFVGTGNSNVTIKNNANIVTCSGQDILLGTMRGRLLFHSSGGGSFGAPTQVSEVCDSAATQNTIASSETVTFSATPTFSTAKRASIITLTGNITSFTLAAGLDGQEKTLTFCQDATGGRTLAGPANVRGLFPSGIGGSASLCNSQHFTYSTAQAAWLADSVGIINQ